VKSHYRVVVIGGGVVGVSVLYHLEKLVHAVGAVRPARILPGAPYDPAGAKLRG
jgi:glycine/D-amino acid oxidase-like deaminating enzyme